MFKALIIVFICIVLAAIPVWLYASGNTPYMPLENEALVVNAQNAFPRFSRMTYGISHGISQHIRTHSKIMLPHTINERIARIFETRRRTIAICNEILVAVEK